jgi:nicotinamidase-related amidase
MQTHMCVEAAVRAASDLGYSCILVEDACATRTLQYGEHIISAGDVHHATLKTLEGSYASITRTQEFLRNTPKNGRH